MIFFLPVILFLYCFFMFFSSKLLCLLFLEGVMISCIFMASFSYSCSMFLFPCLLVLSVFMVLDSVLGVSLVLMSTRSGSSEFSDL